MDQQLFQVLMSRMHPQSSGQPVAAAPHAAVPGYGTALAQIAAANVANAKPVGGNQSAYAQGQMAAANTPTGANTTPAMGAGAPSMPTEIPGGQWRDRMPMGPSPMRQASMLGAPMGHAPMHRPGDMMRIPHRPVDGE